MIEVWISDILSAYEEYAEGKRESNSGEEDENVF